MMPFVSGDRLRFLFNRFRERLWVRPLAICLLSIAGAFVAKLADGTALNDVVPHINAESITSLLSVMAASMLVIATFAVASMVSAYASAAGSATPRTFPLVVADDVSQNALSTFIGAFIFSIVSLTAVKNEYFETAGLFTLFVLTVTVFGLVVLTFVGWVDRIARLGRLGATIDKVERAAADALKRRRDAPTLRGAPVAARKPEGRAVFASAVGYVQHVDAAALQACTETVGGRVVVASLQGTFAVPGRPLAYVCGVPEDQAEAIAEQAVRAFTIGGERRFDDDPRFGLIVLSEIAGRALSPAVNDPGTAIDIVGTLVRLFVLWNGPPAGSDAAMLFDRVEVPQVSVEDMFDDAFTAIARDGAGSVEVAVRLQKALRSLASIGSVEMRSAALRHSRMALARAEKALALPEDFAVVCAAAGFSAAEVSREGTQV